MKTHSNDTMGAQCMVVKYFVVSTKVQVVCSVLFSKDESLQNLVANGMQIRKLARGCQHRYSRISMVSA